MVFKKVKNCQSGFTLVEIAIVMVIIGLLVGGILKGQALVYNAKIKRIVKDMEGVRAAVFTFQDTYGMFPGDENKTGIPVGDTSGGDNDGHFDEDDGYAIEDLRLAKLLSDNPGNIRALPSHVFGGTIRVDWVTINVTRDWIVCTNLPAEVCAAIDANYDDGVYDSGAIQGSAGYTAEATLTFGWEL